MTGPGPTGAIDVPEARIQPTPFDFEAVFAAEYGRVSRAIARVIRDPSRTEDLVLDAFWKLWTTRGAHGPSAAAWLRRTAVRLALDELRRRARRARYEALLGVAGSPRQPDDLFSAAEDRGRVRAVLAALPRRDAELLVLRSDSHSYEELATLLGLNPSSVGTLLHRAKQAFRKEYGRRYGER